MAHTLGSMYQEEVRPMLKLVEDLDSILEGHGTNVALPQIAVVGNQSSGKSSVLQRISSVRLPQASDLCTRAPLILSMRDSSQSAVTVYVGKGKERLPSSEIEAQIRKRTRALAGNGNGISERAIKLQIEAPALPDLTLIDLPGIVQVPKEGQPEDIAEQVQQTILQHIEPENTLILCVFAGNQDLETSPALQLARKVDPEGHRTLGVITKLDLVPHQERKNLYQKIMQLGQQKLKKPVKLGFIAVCNWLTETSGAGSPGTQSSEAAEDAEANFLKGMQELRQVPGDHLGVPALVKKLCHLQREHVKKTVPKISQQLRSTIAQAESELKEIGGCMNKEESLREFRRQLALLDMALRNMASANYQAIDELAPNLRRLRPEVQTILEKFNLQLQKQAPKVFEDCCTGEVQQALKETSGLTLPNLLSHETFNSLIRKWQEPYGKLVLEAFQYAHYVATDIVEELSLAVLRSELQGLMRHKLCESFRSQYNQGVDHLTLILKMESCVIDTLNNYYSVTLSKLQSLCNIAGQGGCGVLGGMASTEKELEALLSEEQISSFAESSGAQGQPSANTQRNTFVNQPNGIQQNSCGNPTTKIQQLLGKMKARAESHKPDDHKLLTLQMSAYCYDKVVRKRLADDLLRSVRFFFVEFAAGQLGFQLSQNMTAETAHELLRASEADIQKKRQLEAKVVACRNGLNRIYQSGLSSGLSRMLDGSSDSKMSPPSWAENLVEEAQEMD